MTRARVRIIGPLAAVLICCGASTAQTPLVVVHTSLSRTAVWIGDRTIYTVELRCAPQVDVLLDDLASGRLRVDGGDIVGVEEDHDDTKDGPIRRFRYTLVSYRADVAELRIAAIPVRYYTRRTNGVQDAPAGQVSVPPTVIAVRSAIPDGGGVPPVRVPTALRPPPRYLAIAQPAGLILIALAIVPIALLSADLAGRGRQAWARYRVRRTRREQRMSLEELRSISPDTAAERVHAFDRLDALVREHLVLATGIPAHALTPGEIRRALDERAPSRAHADVEALLAACERARYAPDPPSADAWPDALRDAEQVVGPGRR